jgi:hypothetical protein
MNYTAHMSNGGTISLVFKNGVDTRGWLQDGLAWLVDDSGVMVNVKYVQALVPTAVPEKAATMRRFKDIDGAVWTQCADGLYEYPGCVPRSWAALVNGFGPLEEVTENY